MALINDELIKRYQRWFKENNGTTLDKYTARAHLKQMMGQGGKPSSTSGGMRTMAGGQAYERNAQGGYGPPAMISSGSMLPPSVRSVAMGGAKSNPFFRGLENEAKAQKEIDKRAYDEERYQRKREQKLQDDLRDEKIKIETAVNKIPDSEIPLPPEISKEKDLAKESAYFNDWRTAEKQKRVDAISQYYDIGKKPPVAVKKAVKSKTVMEDEPGPKYGGGSIEVTGDARPGDAKKGTIAITGGNPDNPKQWIFEPTDDGNYIAKRPIPGSFNKWETGKVVSPGDLYDMTKGEFGSKGPSYISTDPDMMDGMDAESVIDKPRPPVRVEKFGSTTTTPETDYIPPVDYAEEMWGMMPARKSAGDEYADEPQQDKIENMNRKNRAGQDDFIMRGASAIGNWWNGIQPTTSREDVYENIPQMPPEERPALAPQPMIRETPGSVPIDKVGRFSRPSPIPYDGIQPLSDEPAISGLGEALAPRGNAWDDAETATGMGREMEQWDALAELHPDWTPEEINRELSYMTRGGLGTSLEWPSADYMGY